MQGPGGARERTVGTHPVVLLALLVGFLAMHGFLALSAGPGPTALAHAATGVHTEAGTHHTTADAPAPGPAPAPDHHDLVTGCVVALVGVVALALAATLLPDRRPAAPSRRRAVATPGRWVAATGPGRPPPRLALCVLRV